MLKIWHFGAASVCTWHELKDVITQVVNCYCSIYHLSSAHEKALMLKSKSEG